MNNILHSALSAIQAWGPHELQVFADEFPAAALNSVLFGVVIGGTYNWLRTRPFRKQLDHIAESLSLIHRTTALTSQRVFETFNQGEVDDYRDLKLGLEEQNMKLRDFYFSYAPYFNVKQTEAFREYRDLFEDTLSRLLISRISSNWHAENRFELKTFGPPLFSQDRLGPLLSSGKDRFAQLDDLFSLFLRSIGVSRWLIKKLRAGDDASKADLAIRALWSHIRELVPASDLPVVAWPIGEHKSSSFRILH